MFKKWAKTKRGLITLLCGLVLLMFGFTYALVPLYDVFCDITGLNGKTGGRIRAPLQTRMDKSRNITVEFVTRSDQGLDWDFYTRTRSVMVHPGEPKRVNFYAKNNTRHEITVMAIPSVSPGVAAKYLQKTECFCFDAQTLGPGESVEYPMIFYIDPSMPDIPRLTLSYTLFDANVKKL